MATLRQQAMDHRELNEPLQRSMRRWWAGPGRLWIVAIAMSGFFSISLLAILRAMGNSQVLVFVSKFRGIAGESVPFLSLLAVISLALYRQRMFNEAHKQAAIPFPKEMSVSFFSGTCLGVWPILASLFAVKLAGLLYEAFHSYLRGSNLRFLTRDMAEVGNELSLFLFVTLLILAIFSLFHGSLLRWTAISVVLLHHVLAPLRFLGLDDRRLTMIDLRHEGFGIEMLAGSFLILILLTAMLAFQARAEILAFLSLMILTVFRLVQECHSLVAYNRVSGDSLLSWLFLLRGVELTFTQAPFRFDTVTIMWNNQASGIEAVVLFNDNFIIPTGQYGYILAMILNLIWLALVFLFCRWAVGRSSGREES